ncbi:winged helix-turn-helix transcriptional regulator [Streptomyces sp. NPDC086077]|uniref:winged helix-turn-helix transcriptional regulator n=1 Tax=Streptomyces sp. NPDC086077 TaxID=3154862 RepID=UPI0034185328
MGGDRARRSRASGRQPQRSRAPHQTLRRLQDEGLVERHAYAEAPPHVEYSLTKIGRTVEDPSECSPPGRGTTMRRSPLIRRPPGRRTRPRVPDFRSSVDIGLRVAGVLAGRLDCLHIRRVERAEGGDMAVREWAQTSTDANPIPSAAFWSWVIPHSDNSLRASPFCRPVRHNWPVRHNPRSVRRECLARRSSFAGPRDAPGGPSPLMSWADLRVRPARGGRRGSPVST